MRAWVWAATRRAADGVRAFVAAVEERTVGDGVGFRRTAAAAKVVAAAAAAESRNGRGCRIGSGSKISYSWSRLRSAG